jgi:hypothetical protein
MLPVLRHFPLIMNSNLFPAFRARAALSARLDISVEPALPSGPIFANALASAAPDFASYQTSSYHPSISRFPSTARPRRAAAPPPPRCRAGPTSRCASCWRRGNLILLWCVARDRHASGKSRGSRRIAAHACAGVVDVICSAVRQDCSRPGRACMRETAARRSRATASP